MEYNKIWTRQQVRQILMLLRSTKNAHLRNIYIRNGYIQFTNAYQAHISKKPLIDHTDNMIIKYDDLDVWYKLAKTKDVIDTDIISELMVKTDYNFPPIKRFFEDKEEKLDHITFNKKEMFLFTNIIGEDNIKLKFTGELKPIHSENKHFKSILLPVRTNF